MSGMRLVTIAEEDYRELVSKAEAWEWMAKHSVYWVDEVPYLESDCPPLIKEMIEKEKV